MTCTKVFLGLQLFFTELVKSKTMDRTAQYICSISPLLDINLPHNKSYIVTLEFFPDIADYNQSLVTRISSSKTQVNVSSNEYYSFFEGQADINPILTLVMESRDFHTCLFYLKCIFTPFVVAALIWFFVRMYLNDLYISIPDRLLIACALAQCVQNVPTEVLVANWDNAYLKLLDEFGTLMLTCSLCLFWVIYTKDKLATNEPWERNTRYYWKHILLIVLCALVCALFVIYIRGPSLANPFNNQWTSSSNVSVSLGFIFGLVSLALIYQLYLSILVLKLLCDVPVQHPGLGKSWRIKFILVYCYLASLFTISGFVLRLAMKLSLNWNQQFHIDPVPFHLSYASPFLLGLQGKHLFISV